MSDQLESFISTTLKYFFQTNLVSFETTGSLRKNVSISDGCIRDLELLFFVSLVMPDGKSGNLFKAECLYYMDRCKYEPVLFIYSVSFSFIYTLSFPVFTFSYYSISFHLMCSFTFHFILVLFILFCLLHLFIYSLPLFSFYIFLFLFILFYLIFKIFTALY